MGEGSAVMGGDLGIFFLMGVVFWPSGGEKRFDLNGGNEGGNFSFGRLRLQKNLDFVKNPQIFSFFLDFCKIFAGGRGVGGENRSKKKSVGGGSTFLGVRGGKVFPSRSPPPCPRMITTTYVGPRVRPVKVGAPVDQDVRLLAALGVGLRNAKQKQEQTFVQVALARQQMWRES